MGLRQIKEESGTITGKTVKPAAPVVPVSSKITPLRANQDPIAARLEKRDLTGSPDIDNSGRGCLKIRNAAAEINDIYLNEAQKKEQERLEHGGYTLAEINRMQFCGYQELARPNPIKVSITPAVGVDYTVGQTVRSERDGKIYTAILDKNTREIAYFDDGSSCIMTSAVLGATTADQRIGSMIADGVTINDRFIPESVKYDIEYQVNADGSVQKRSPAEQAVKQSAARLDAQFSRGYLTNMFMIENITAEVAAKSPVFDTAAGSPVKTEIKPAESFSGAKTTAPSLKNPDYVAPLDKLLGKPSANEPKFELKA